MNQTDRHQALSLYRRVLTAWNSRDADAFAAVFAPDGNVVGFDGSPLNGPVEIASTLRDIFGNHQTAAYVGKVREIRALGPDVMLLRAVVGMVPPGAAELNPAVNALQSVVMVGQGSDMRIALFHNTPAAFHGRPQLAAQLTSELTEALRTGQTVTTD